MDVANILSYYLVVVFEFPAWGNTSHYYFKSRGRLDCISYTFFFLLGSMHMSRFFTFSHPLVQVIYELL